MIIRMGGSALLVLLVAAGFAVAATRSTGADPRGVAACANDTNGLVRIADVCRQGETAITLGGSDLHVTRGGTFTVPFGEDASVTVLPLTGVSVTAKCIVPPPEYGDYGMGRYLLSARSGETFDVYTDVGSSGGGKLAATEYFLVPVAGGPPAFVGALTYGLQNVLVKAAGGTATLQLAGHGDHDARVCTFFWQAQEFPY